MAKVTAQCNDVPERPKEKEASSKDSLTKANFTMNPTLLEVIESTIHEISGLTVDDLFMEKEL